jgi:L-malate glycosyltransferase
VLCSESEGLSNAVIEYMWLGTPTVCTDVGGNPEIVHDGETGLLVPPFDVAALTERIDRLLADPAMRVRMADRAHAAARRLTTRRMTALHMDLYERLAGDARWAANAAPAGRAEY